jgi:hypothetical protein
MRAIEGGEGILRIHGEGNRGDSQEISRIHREIAHGLHREIRRSVS